jgi:tetratricopeptide (TPR) repeat protein
MVFAGRAPRVQELSKIEPKFFLRSAQTIPFDDAEISEFFRQYLPEEFTPPDANVIASVRQVTHGNPFLVERLSRLIALERQEDPSWDWTRWNSTCGHFQSDDRYGLLLYVTERLATHVQPGDEDYWRLALPRLLHRDMAEILFPRQEGKPLFGARLIEAYEQAGIVYRRATGDPDQYMLPDETRSALTAKARREGWWQNEVASDLHSRLAQYFDNQHGIQIEALIKSEVDERSLNRDHFVLIGASKVSVISLPVVELLNKDHPALIEAAYHVVVSYVPSRQVPNKIDPERFWRSMAGSIWLNNLDKRLIAALLNSMSRLEIDQLLKSFDDEAESFDKQWSVQVGEELRELGRAGRLVTGWARNPDFFQERIKESNHKAFWLGQYAAFLTNPRRDYDEAERFYKRAIDADPNNARNLGNYAVFLENNRHDHDGAEQYFKFAIEADPNDARNLGAYALFLEMNRHNYGEAERFYKLAIEADPNNAINLGNYAIFLQARRGNYDETEQFHRRAIALNPADANSCGSLAQILMAQGRKEEGREMIAASFVALADNVSPGLLAELWFYRYTHFWSEEPAALSELKRVLLAGDRSPGWSLQPNIERAEADGHPNVALLKTLARVINGEARMEELEADSDWRAA